MQLNERDIIKKQYILLDWNIIKYAKNPRNDTDEEFKRLMEIIRKRYEFPFCEAHLRDLARSYSEANKDKVHEDLCFLQQLSHNVAIGLDENDGFNLVKYSSSDLFEEIINESKANPNITAEMNPQSIYRVDMQELDVDHPLRTMLEKTNGVVGPGIMANWLNNLFEPLFNEIEDYKKFRTYLKNLKRDLNNSSQESLIPQDLVYMSFLKEHMMPFIDSLEIEDEANLALIWKDNIIKWLQMKYPDKVPFGDAITTAYSMLDLHPLFREKLKKKKNTLSNITRDSKMIYYASSSKYFVTEDKTCWEKTKFIFKAFNLSTEVLNISEFIAKFS